MSLLAVTGPPVGKCIAHAVRCTPLHNEVVNYTDGVWYKVKYRRDLVTEVDGMVQMCPYRFRVEREELDDTCAEVGRE